MIQEAAQTERPLAGLLTLVAAVRRRLVIVLICTITVPAAAVAYSLHQRKMYTATASLLFRNPQFDQQLVGTAAFQQTQDPATEQATNLQLVELPVVAQRTAALLGHGLTQAQVTSSVSVSTTGQSSLGTISATDPDPGLAAQIANRYAAEFVVFRRDADRAKVASAVALIKSEIAALPSGTTNQRQALQRSVNQLEVLDALQTGNAEVVQTAQRPSGSSSPKPVRNGMLGAVVGILLGLGLAVLLERLDSRLKELSAVADAFGRPILAVIPQSSAISDHRRGESGHGTLETLPAADAEAFRMLRVSLRYFNIDERMTSVVITSSSQGDGKSTAATYLALAAAEAGTKTLLLEADLRHPTIGERLGIASSGGLSLLLSGQAELAAAVTQISVRPQETAGRAPERFLDVIVSGPVPPNPSDLIDSLRMRELIQQAELEYELVVIDTPPTLVVSDAVPLLKEVSAVVVVARAAKTTRESAEALRRQLENVGANVLGVLVNSVRPEGGGYYGYADGYLTEAKTHEPGEPEVPARHEGPTGNGTRPANGVAFSAEQEQEQAQDPVRRRLRRRDRKPRPSASEATNRKA